MDKLIVQLEQNIELLNLTDMKLDDKMRIYNVSLELLNQCDTQLSKIEQGISEPHVMESDVEIVNLLTELDTVNKELRESNELDKILHYYTESNTIITTLLQKLNEEKKYYEIE